MPELNHDREIIADTTDETHTLYVKQSSNTTPQWTENWNSYYNGDNVIVYTNNGYRTHDGHIVTIWLDGLDDKYDIVIHDDAGDEIGCIVAPSCAIADILTSLQNKSLSDAPEIQLKGV